MGNFIVFAISCWFGLGVLCVIFISRQRKKTLLLRSFAKLAKNQCPERWTATESTNGLPREYSTKVADSYLVLGKYPKKKKENGNKIIYYSYRMFISRENGVDAIFNGWRIAKTYKQVDGERRRTEKIIEKWRKLGARIRKNDILIPA